MGVRSTNPIQSFIDDFYRSGKDAVSPVPPPTGITATGGIISDYVSGSKYYRAHSFTGSGTFTVSKLGPLPTTLEYLVIAGGGGGGCHSAGGGGAGGFYTNMAGATQGGGGTLGPSISASVRSYTITVGAGGAGAVNNPGTDGTQGDNSVFDAGGTPVSATGGGFGAGYNRPGGTGGSGGGGAHSSSPAAPNKGSGTANQGYDGGYGNDFGNAGMGGGGGGAGAAGGNTPGPGPAGPGGNGGRHQRSLDRQ